MLGIGRCAKYRDLLWDYEAGRLSGMEAEGMRRHMACCPRCQAEAARCRVALGALRAHRDRPVPDSHATWRDLLARIDAPQPRPVRRPARRPVWAAGVTAAAAASLAIAFIVGRPPLGRSPVAMSNLGGVSTPAPAVLATGPAIALVAPTDPVKTAAEAETQGVPAARRAPVRSETRRRPEHRRIVARKPDADASPVFRPSARAAHVAVDADTPVAPGAHRAFVIGTAPDRGDGLTTHYVVGAPAGSIPTGAVMEASAW